jgi:UDP-N-acetylglucosamine--N-acetylmuramyl-(pentapeptide) pyrophosphoryl-undecaprenol N-acetylglucosamine transferase
LHARQVSVTGTPVRPGFFAAPSASDRAALGLRPDGPVLLVMGGSQGASGVNDLALRALPLVHKAIAGLQVLHLTGRADFDKVRAAHEASGVCAAVLPFLERMDLALGLATLAVSRSGASSLAEMAAARLPSLLIPFPAATDNHQFHNAREFVQTGAARMLEQKSTSPEVFAAVLIELLSNRDALARMQEALTRWQQPHAADQIADSIMRSIGNHSEPAPASRPAANPSPEKSPDDFSRVFAPAETGTGAPWGK